MHSDLKVVGKHEPEYSVETDASGIKYNVELPGFYSIGVEIDGVFVPLMRRKAAGLFADIKRAQAAAAQAPSASQ